MRGVMEQVRRVSRGIKKVTSLLSPKGRETKRQELYEVIERATLVEKFFESRVWTEIISPYLQKEKDGCIKEMANHQKRYPEDLGKFTQTGILQAVTGLIVELKSIQNQKPEAEQELELLGRSEEEEKK